MRFYWKYSDPQRYEIFIKPNLCSFTGRIKTAPIPVKSGVIIVTWKFSACQSGI